MDDDTKPRNARLFSDQAARALAPKSNAQGVQLGSFARGRYGERACSVSEAQASEDLRCAQHRPPFFQLPERLYSRPRQGNVKIPAAM
ncbi:hypothetical protein M0D47_16185 [Xanthomonas prunicola]|uniref:hypothetical protein n=1 Tax=Xanthomonas prunicola TaxID=2053930 RepID=UPI0013FDE46C|nr:hypothetical protein [Xanthomonas prunicola]UXA56330.1 hypothetical protein M0D47_16185 [Xanthomonas prunicola]